MSFQNFGVAVMAAGKGTRLKSKRPKVLHEVGGRALLLHVIAAAKTVASPQEIFCIVGHEAARVQTAVEATGVAFVTQSEQRGTGHALQMVRDHFASGNTRPPEHLLVLSGDVPLIRPETLQTLCETHLREAAAMTILTAIPPDPTGYGRVLRTAPGSAEVEAIVEQKSLREDQRGEPEINSGIYCFRTDALFKQLGALTTSNAHGEYYLTDIAELLRAAGERVVAVAATRADEVLGANTIAEMMHLDATMRGDAASRLMAAGVTIFRPETCTIDAEVTVGADTIIEAFVQLLGSSSIGSGCRIRSYSVVQDSVLGDDVLVRNGCILDHARVDDGALLGPYAHLRPGSDIGPKAHLGNFVETKNTRLGEGSKANHLTYLGDAIIGTGVNVGAGTITCNYDGAKKHITTIEDGAFIGSDSTLIAPVTIERGAYVAAGSCITHHVPSDALALGRSPQVTKPGWAAAKRATRNQQKGK